MHYFNLNVIVLAKDIKIMSNLALTDLYQLTMAQAYLDSGKADEIVTFEYFIRSLPQDWGYFVVCGIDKLIKDITELNFQSLNTPRSLVAAINLLPTAAFEELIACFIRASEQHSDRRIVLVGIPTRVGNSSMYNLQFYEKLRETLHHFGFQEVCKPYKNESSSNTIVVLVAQMP